VKKNISNTKPVYHPPFLSHHSTSTSHLSEIQHVSKGKSFSLTIIVLEPLSLIVLIGSCKCKSFAVDVDSGSELWILLRSIPCCNILTESPNIHGYYWLRLRKQQWGHDGAQLGFSNRQTWIINIDRSFACCVNCFQCKIYYSSTVLCTRFAWSFLYHYILQPQPQPQIRDSDSHRHRPCICIYFEYIMFMSSWQLIEAILHNRSNICQKTSSERVEKMYLWLWSQPYLMYPKRKCCCVESVWFYLLSERVWSDTG
jgi:hypothetical protein